MNGQAKLKENTFYSILYQIVVFITPLITSPYLSRVLSPDGMGVFSYTQTIVNYFFLVGMLGINNYGSRTIARTKDDPKALSNSFWQIYYLQLMQAAVVIVSFLVSVRHFSTENNRVVFLVQGLQILSIVTDVNWFAFGMEKFKFTTIRNLVIKLFSLISIFIFVNSPDDVWVYSLLVGAGTISGLLAIWPLIIRETQFQLPKFKLIFSHFKPNFILFLPQIGASLQSIDKVMLGRISDSTVGYYSYAEHILNVPFGLITAITTVFMPRISNLIANGDKDEADKLLNTGFHYTGIISIVMCFGMVSVARLFVPLYLGDQYMETAIILQYLAVLLPIQGAANILRMMYLVPNKKDSIYMITVTAGAVSNLIGNIIMIPLWDARGACISTIISSVVSLVLQIILTRKELRYGKMFGKLCPYIIYGAVMMLVISFINMIKINSILLLLIEVVIGGILFVVLALIHMALVEKDYTVILKIKKMLRR